MNVRLTLKTDTFSANRRGLASGLMGAPKRVVLLAMAREFGSISMKNFGPSGVDRPEPWKRLKKDYRSWKQKNYGRSTADLLLNKDLFRSFKIRCENDQFAEVMVDSPYAATHQYGQGPIPRRAFLPLTRANNLTPYARARMLNAAERAIYRLMGI